MVRKGFPLLVCLTGESLASFPWDDGVGTAK
jgi:hypothetical protein